jgi:hypothetical protein
MDASASLLQRLGQSLGLDSLAPDSDGSCSVTFDGAVTVEFRPDHANSALILFSALAQLSPGQRTALAPRLLEANLFWQDTGGATLGVSAAGLAILCLREPLAALDLTRLRQVLEIFLNSAETWRHFLDRAVESPATAAPFAAPAGLLRA